MWYYVTRFLTPIKRVKESAGTPQVATPRRNLHRLGITLEQGGRSRLHPPRRAFTFIGALSFY